MPLITYRRPINAETITWTEDSIRGNYANDIINKAAAMQEPDSKKEQLAQDIAALLGIGLENYNALQTRQKNKIEKSIGKLASTDRELILKILRDDIVSRVGGKGIKLPEEILDSLMSGYISSGLMVALRPAEAPEGKAPDQEQSAPKVTPEPAPVSREEW